MVFYFSGSLQADVGILLELSLFEPTHDKTNKMTCAPSEDSDQPGHLPSLTGVFAVQRH